MQPKINPPQNEQQSISNSDVLSKEPPKLDIDLLLKYGVSMNAIISSQECGKLDICDELYDNDQ